MQTLQVVDDSFMQVTMNLPKIYYKSIQKKLITPKVHVKETLNRSQFCSETPKAEPVRQNSPKRPVIKKQKSLNASLNTKEIIACYFGEAK